MAKIKLKKQMLLRPFSSTQYKIQHDYDPDMLPFLRDYPGTYWYGPGRHHYCGIDSEAIVRRAYEAKGYEVLVEKHKVDIPNLANLDSRLHDYQCKGVTNILQKKKFLLNYEMGLGKTPTAIGALQLQMAATQAFSERIWKALIVCPALVRLNWEDEFDKWWPDHPMIINLQTGKQASLYLKTTYSEPHIIITSYGLIGKFTKKVKNERSIVTFEIDEGLPSLDAIILDECHYVKNNKSGRSKQVKAICTANPDAYKVGLSATPITSEPKDLWHQIEVLRPQAFGGYTAFKERYTNSVPNEYAYSGLEWKGLNEEYADELRERLAAITQRVTKEEVAHLLPPFKVQSLRLPRVKTLNSRELFEGLSSGIRKQHELDAAVQLAGDHKVNAAIDQAFIALESHETVCILAYFRDTALKIATGLDEALSKLKKTDPLRYLQIEHVDGDVPIKKRMEFINKAKTGKTILVATIGSINVGIDLTHWTTAVFAELYWQPACMIQALGRFSRLSGKLPSTCLLLTIEGSLDEPIAFTLQRRLNDQAELFKGGLAEKGMLDSLGNDEDDEAWLEALNRAVEGRVEEAYL